MNSMGSSLNALYEYERRARQDAMLQQQYLGLGVGGVLGAANMVQGAPQTSLQEFANEQVKQDPAANPLLLLTGENE